MEKHPDLKLKVYAVWFENIWTDARRRWPEDALSDPRVVHYWDEQKAAGRWYEEHVTRRGGAVEWDAYFLYGPDTEWDETPPKQQSWGRPIMNARKQFRSGFAAHLVIAANPFAVQCPRNSVRNVSARVGEFRDLELLLCHLC